MEVLLEEVVVEVPRGVAGVGSVGEAHHSSSYLHVQLNWKTNLQRIRKILMELLA